MNPNQPHTPSQPADDNVVHFNLDHDATVAPLTPNAHSLTGSKNFVDDSEAGLFDFDLEDLENLFNTPPQTNSTFDTRASAENEKIATPTALDPNEHSLVLDKLELDKVDKAENLSLDHSLSAVVPNPVINAPVNTPTLEKFPPITPEPVVAPTPDSVTTHNSSTTADTAILATALGTTATVATLATNASDSPSSTKKGFFSQFGNKKSQPNPVTPTILITPTTSSNIAPIIVAKQPTKNNKPLLILLGLLLLGALAWLASQFFAEPEPAPQPAPKATPVAKAPTATATPTPDSATIATSAPMTTVAPVPAVVTQTSSVSVTATPHSDLTIKPEEILSAPLPKDNAIAKEELDRLADQSKQLSQQEKMKEEQLKMMNELASKKEERIAILEKQIAQAEAQKAQAKK